MRIPVNLASQPFRRDRAVMVTYGAIAAGLTVLLIFLVSLDLSQSGLAAETRQNIARLEGQIQKVSLDQARQDLILRKPENAAVLERSVFLNALLYRKGISWTRIFMDLEKVVPHDVRIIAIRPSVYSQNGRNQVSLDMTIGSDSVPPVIELLKNLETSPQFGAIYSHTLLPPTQSDKVYRCRVSVNYAQNL